jgi:chemotaxis protein CheD
MPQEYSVGMGDVHFHKGDAVFTALGLGSCIGLVMWDPVARVGGMIHVMLPNHFADKPLDKVGKFADTGIPFMLDKLKTMGASPTRIQVVYAGGAQVFSFPNRKEPKIEVGARNIAAVEQLVKHFGLKVIAKDVGGSNGRTVIFNSSTGAVRVRTLSKGETTLCSLEAATAARTGS